MQVRLRSGSGSSNSSSSGMCTQYCACGVGRCSSA
jgi:hypothetical protein